MVQRGSTAEGRFARWRERQRAKGQAAREREFFDLERDRRE
jgi:hypothetical protein